MIEERDVLICDGCGKDFDDANGGDSRWLREEAAKGGWSRRSFPGWPEPLDLCVRCTADLVVCVGCGQKHLRSEDRETHARSCWRLRDRVVIERLIAQAEDDGRSDEVEELQFALDPFGLGEPYITHRLEMAS